MRIVVWIFFSFGQRVVWSETIKVEALKQIEIFYMYHFISEGVLSL